MIVACLFSFVCMFVRMLVYVVVVVFSMYRLYGEQRSFVKEE